MEVFMPAKITADLGGGQATEEPRVHNCWLGNWGAVL
jgi:hypothetical protein